MPELPVPEKDELDRYQIPARKRVKIFQWGLTGLGTTASILLVMLIQCYKGNESRTERLKNEQIELLQKQIERETDHKITQIDNKLSPKLDSVAKRTDTLKAQIDVLKN